MKKQLLIALMVTCASQSLLAKKSMSNSSATASNQSEVANSSAAAQMIAMIQTKLVGNISGKVGEGTLDQIMSGVQKIADRVGTPQAQAKASKIRTVATEAKANHYTRKQTKDAMIAALKKKK